MKKICPILLIVWPYLILPVLFLDIQFSIANGGMTFLIIYCVLTPVVYLSNILCACLNKNVRSLSFWDMLLKLFHIPFYLVMFLLGISLAGQLIMGSPFGLMVVPILVVIDCVLLITTSSYGVSALIRSKAKGNISSGFLVVNAVMHFVFVLDVISSIIVFCKVRMRKPTA